MTVCKFCRENHASEDHKLLSEKGSTDKMKGYPAAHEKANKAEKKKFGTIAFDSLRKLDAEAGRKHKLVGKNTPKGKIEVSKAVPKNRRKEVAYHEKVESRILRKKK